MKIYSQRREDGNWNMQIWSMVDDPSPDEVCEWLEENLGTKHDFAFRFNSGDPYIWVLAADDETKLLIEMRWA